MTGEQAIEFAVRGISETWKERRDQKPYITVQINEQQFADLMRMVTKVAENIRENQNQIPPTMRSLIGEASLDIMHLTVRLCEGAIASGYKLEASQNTLDKTRKLIKITEELHAAGDLMGEDRGQFDAMARKHGLEL